MVNKSPKIKELLLDVLKPNEPSIIELAKVLSNNKNIKSVNIGVYDVDKKTENVHITLNGKNLNYIKIKSVIEKQGAVIHSIDGVLVEN